MNKKWIWPCLFAGALTVLGTTAYALEAYEEETDYEEVIIEVTEEEGKEHLLSLEGSYVSMYDILLNDPYADYWMETAMLLFDDEEEAAAEVKALQDANTGKVIGEEAVEAYDDGENYEELAFCSDFLNDLAHITIKGMHISGEDTQGNELFSYDYAFDGCDPYSGLYQYKADADDAGMFSYFCFTYHTPEETGHIEFRYGDDPVQLNDWLNGDYAYWMACGISDGDDQKEMAEKTIDVIIEDNLFI